MDKVLRLVLIEDDPVAAELLIQALNADDVIVHAQQVTDVARLSDALQNQSPDMVLCALDSKSVSLEQTLASIHETGKPVPVISLAANGAADVADCMRKGAVDLVDKRRTDHLKRVVARTAEAHQNSWEAKRLEAALRESEKRCRSLLESSRDAICYLRDGMHLYANRPYLELFGYTTLSDIEGTPIMDRIAPDHRGTMKDFLVGLESAEKDEHLDIELTRADEQIFGARVEISTASIEGEACIQAVIRVGLNEGRSAPPVDKPSTKEPRQEQSDEAWVAHLRDALQAERMRLLFQPIVSLRGHPGERFEVFLRALDETGEAIDAAEFLSRAERAGMAGELDRWVLTHAIGKLAEMCVRGTNTIFFVKLTADSLQDFQLSSWLRECLSERPVPPGSLVLSIKERIAVKHLKQAKTLLKDLRELQCGFALDAFGAGLNPAQLLKTLPVDYLKVDRSLMEGIATNTAQQENLRKIVNISKSVGAENIVQYVEEATALSALWGMGVNFIQGYFLRAPSESLDYDFSALG